MVPGDHRQGKVLPGGTRLKPFPFAKVEALANTFVLIESGSIPLEEEPRFAVAASRKSFGVGSDGLLVVGRRANGLELRMYNPDGSADFCGNGLRSAAWFAHSRGWIGSESSILHGGLEVPARIVGQTVTIELPQATFEPSQVPVSSVEPWIEREVEGIVGTAVSTGSTHFVVFRDELPNDEEFFSASPRVEVAEVFPERTSVMWATRSAEDRFQVRIWERGAGETRGCGTGSLAVAAAARMLLSAPPELEIQNPGGTLRYRDKGPVVEAASPASVVFVGSWLSKLSA